MIQRWFAPGVDCPDAIAIRMEVFVLEQNVPEEDEVDAFDASCWHIVLYDGELPVATGRLIDEGNHVWRPSRIAVKRSYRSKGIGAELVSAMMQKAGEFGANRLNLVAQCQAQGFYERCGFVSLHEYCMDAGIKHVKMEYLY